MKGIDLGRYDHVTHNAYHVIVRRDMVAKHRPNSTPAPSDRGEMQDAIAAAEELGIIHPDKAMDLYITSKHTHGLKFWKASEYSHRIVCEAVDAELQHRLANR